jgi:PAS domain S-box-containing protein
MGQILDDAPFMIQVKDAALRYLWFNKAHLESRLKIAGARDDIVGKTATEAGLDPALAAIVDNHDREVMATGLPGEPREQTFRPPGEDDLFVTLVSKVPLRTDGRISHIATMSADTGQWRAAQIRNEDARRLLELVMDAAPITIQVIDRDMRFRWVNRAYRELFEASDRPLIGEDIADVPRSRSIAEATRLVNEEIFATEKGPVQVEQSLPETETNAPVHLLVTKMPVRDRDGRVWGILTMGTDVTALNQARARADVADSVISGLLRHAPMSIQVKDADLRIRWLNQSFADAVNRPLEDILGKTLEELSLPPAGVARTNDMDRKVLSEGASFQFDERWIMPDGRYRYVRTIKAALRDQIGCPTHVITLGVDITETALITAELRELTDKLERRVAERTAELREANELINTVIESAPMPIGVFHMDGTVRLWNPAAERVTGYSIVEAFEGLTSGQSPEVRTELQAMVTSVQVGHAVPPREMKVRRKDGTHADLLAVAAPLVGAEGQVQGVVISWLDVTELRQSEAEKHQFLDVFDKAEVGLAVIEMTPNGRVRPSNPAMHRLFRSQPGRIHMRPQDEFFAEKDVALGREMIATADRDGHVSFEATLRREDGSTFQGLVSLTSVPPEGDKHRRRIFTIIDISKQHQIEEQLRQAQKMEAVGQLTGGIAHDFNNLLTTILGNSELLEFQAEDMTAPVRASVRRIREAGERAALLTKQMLAFSRKQSLRPVVVDVNHLIGGMSEILRRTLGEHITVGVRLANDLRPVLIDANQLENAVLNLAINARDAMPDGGQLTIQTLNVWLDDATAIENALPPGGCVMLVVSDTGVGMDEDAKEHAFEPFFTTKPVGKGTGLGLSQVYGFVKQSGGHVALSSTPGLGTVVTICLPHHQSVTTSDVADGEPPIPSPAPGGGTILIVEPDAAARERTRAVLTELGYPTMTASDAAEALDHLDRHPEIVLLFSALMLPGMGGVGLAREASQRYPDLRVILTSGHTGDRVRETGPDHPVAPNQPFPIRHLAARIRQALDPAGSENPTPPS